MQRPPFEVVVERHGPMVLRVCRAVLGPVDADDAWSETFLAALRAWPQLPAGTVVEAWLVTVAHRKALDVLRTRSRRRTDPVADLPDRSVGQDPLQSEALDASGVWAQVGSLPTKQRQVLAYRYLGGLPYADIADLVGGTPAAARRAAADGLATLRTRMTPPAPGATDAH